VLFQRGAVRQILNGKAILYENRFFPFNINPLRNHVFAGARHAVPLPGDPVSTAFMNMKLRFHRSLCPRRAWGLFYFLRLIKNSIKH
jgi:hypothetical protein